MQTGVLFWRFFFGGVWRRAKDLRLGLGSFLLGLVGWSKRCGLDLVSARLELVCRAC